MDLILNLNIMQKVSKNMRYDEKPSIVLKVVECPKMGPSGNSKAAQLKGEQKAEPG